MLSDVVVETVTGMTSPPFEGTIVGLASNGVRLFGVGVGVGVGVGAIYYLCICILIIVMQYNYIF
jgi:hypothetical protein